MTKVRLLFCLLFLIPPYLWGEPIVADFACVDRFSEIPLEAVEAASRLRVMFRHASVGMTINNALDCLQGTRDHPSVCSSFPDYRYDRRKWSFQARSNSGWYGKIDDFAESVRAAADEYDVFSFKFCYLDGLDGLREPCGSPHSTQETETAWNYLRDHMEALEAEFPDKVFVWCTIPLTQTGQLCTEVLNERIRSYVEAEEKALFDIADIEARDEEGVLEKNAQGWEIACRAFCGEQRPDAQACHPNWDGSIRLAKAFWWLMARVGGWEESVEEKAFLRGDANADSEVDVGDAVTILSYLFAGQGPIDCEDSADTNDDGKVDISDAVRVLLFLFAGDVPLPEPSSGCGADPTGDDLPCGKFTPCE